MEKSPIHSQQALGDVVIVDDAGTLRAILRSLLTAEGYRVVAELPTGTKLLETVERLQPAIVCLDINLPGIDGMTLLREIHARHREVAVVMLSGTGDESLEKQAAEFGAAGFIRKPFSQTQLLGELQQVVHAQRLIAQAQQAAESLPIDGLEPARAIIADDSDTLRQLLTVILTQAGIMVLGEASNGEEAVRLAGEIRPDLVFLDVNMPVMNGIEALERIRSVQPEVRAMMITACADREMVAKSARDGARGYILKPYRPDRVIEAVRKLLQS